MLLLALLCLGCLCNLVSGQRQSVCEVLVVGSPVSDKEAWALKRANVKCTRYAP